MILKNNLLTYLVMICFAMGVAIGVYSGYKATLKSFSGRVIMENENEVKPDSGTYVYLLDSFDTVIGVSKTNNKGEFKFSDYQEGFYKIITISENVQDDIYSISRNLKKESSHNEYEERLHNEIQQHKLERDRVLSSTMDPLVKMDSLYVIDEKARLKVSNLFEFEPKEISKIYDISDFTNKKYKITLFNLRKNKIELIIDMGKSSDLMNY